LAAQAAVLGSGDGGLEMQKEVHFQGKNGSKSQNQFSAGIESEIPLKSMGV